LLSYNKTAESGKNEETKKAKEGTTLLPRYPIQRRLKLETNNTKEETLSQQFIVLTERIRDAVKEFSNGAKLLRSQMLKQHMQLSNSIISRIHSIFLFLK